jgi:hypothetical protein
MGRAIKGSRYCLQNHMINNPIGLTDLVLSASLSLLTFTDNQVKWISPKPINNFYEFRDDFLEGLSLENIDLADAEKKLRNFWSKGGPQWDGLAIVEGKSGKKGILLVEAKAHPDETKSDLKATSKVSVDLIEKSISEVQNYMNAKSRVWTKEYYQLANRLCYLYFLNNKLNIPTWLILINFVNDTSFKPTTLSEWLNHYKGILGGMGIDSNCNLLDRVILTFPPAI